MMDSLTSWMTQHGEGAWPSPAPDRGVTTVRSSNQYLILDWVRRIRKEGDRPACPHCRNRSVVRWGRFSGRQRYRCRACGRTFSDLTGTALWRCRQLQAWPAVARLLEDGVSIRRVGEACGLAPSTVFRWRHRFLSAACQATGTGTAGGVRRIATWMVGLRESHKGSPLRRTSPPAPPRIIDTFTGLPSNRISWVWVLATIERMATRDSPSLCFRTVWVGPHRPPAEQLLPHLAARSNPGAHVYHHDGHLGPMSRVARTLRLRSIPLNTGHRVGGTATSDAAMARHEGRKMELWMRRFRGVGTHYMDGYLAWYSLVAPGYAPARPILSPPPYRTPSLLPGMPGVRLLALLARSGCHQHPARTLPESRAGP